ncbi:MAG TPA: tetratricopeptide repeat protein [Actinocrinis sp.]|uniref:tetratricopeptide repeat protein n=1 Tax=Actinocrinis sp. TaxID=1920516 RepID=UPI002DDCA937|nr:tetratricopeptide repeat protein [Actinocrinis sp.]HEV2344596.1 tetratricopeptide repeat protein [Actinocrinis sp.]
MTLLGGPDETIGAADRNWLGGTVSGSVVQAGAVHGGIHFHQTPATFAPVPRQLPAPPPRFLGRAQELTRLDQMSRPDLTAGPALVMLEGPAGVGKSALGLTWLYRNRELFPDGQLHADLRVLDEPASPYAILRSFLTAFAVPPELLPTSLADCVALYRSVTAGRRIAVLLDGAVSTAQIRPLIPGGTSATTLVTSTWRLAGLALDGARWLTVAPLPVDDSVRLLADVAGTGRVDGDPASAREVARLCGGLPLALCIVGAQLAARPYQGLSGMAAELADEQRRLARLAVEGDGLRQIIDACYRDLPQDVARLYRLLGALPVSRINTAPASAAAALSAEQVRTLLQVLADANLLQQVDSEDYVFHDLVRLHAREMGEAAEHREEQGAAIVRVMDWYLASAISAATAVRPYRRDVPEPVPTVVAPRQFADMKDALDWLDAQAHDLLSLARHAAGSGRADFALRLAGQMWALFAYRKYYRVWEEFDLLGLECARSLGKSDHEARMLRRLGLLYTDVGRYEDAISVLGDAAALFGAAGETHREATALDSLGVGHLRRGEAKTAVGYLNRALETHRRLGDRRQVGLTLIDLGDALIESGKADQAKTSLLEAASVLDGSPDVYSLAHLHMLIGRAHGRTGTYDDAQRELDSALRAMQSVDSGFGQAEALGYLGELAEQTGDVAVARRHYLRATELLVGFGSPQTAWLSRRIRSLTPLARSVLDRDPSD